MSKAKPEPILSLVGMGPSYMSKNSEVGKMECLGFFPIGYMVGSETGEPEPVSEEEKPKKKKKKGKHRRDPDETDANIESGGSEQPLQPKNFEGRLNYRIKSFKLF